MFINELKIKPIETIVEERQQGWFGQVYRMDNYQKNLQKKIGKPTLQGSREKRYKLKQHPYSDRKLWKKTEKGNQDNYKTA